MLNNKYADEKVGCSKLINTHINAFLRFVFIQKLTPFYDFSL